jgi:hypothetical protein
MHRPWMTVSASVIISASWVVASADSPSAATTQSNDAQTQKLVYRLYSATFGANEFCKTASPEGWPDFKTQLDRFSAKYPELLKLLRDSQYYAQSAQHFAQKAAEMAVRETPQAATADCRAFTKLLQSLIDEPSGQKAVLDYEAQLAPRS